MNLYVFVVIVVMSVLMVICCVLLVALELRQASNVKNTVDRRLLETKLELRRLRRVLETTQARTACESAGRRAAQLDGQRPVQRP